MWNEASQEGEKADGLYKVAKKHLKTDFPLVAAYVDVVP